MTPLVHLSGIPVEEVMLLLTCWGGSGALWLAARAGLGQRGRAPDVIQTALSRQGST